MKWKKSLYLTHRWLALLISLQLLALSVGGCVFSVLDVQARSRFDIRRKKGSVPANGRH